MAPARRNWSARPGIVATTLFVAGSIRETLPALMFDVQIAPSPAATYWLNPNGACGSPRMSAVTSAVAVSIR